MLCVDCVGCLNRLFVPMAVTCFVAAEKKQCDAARIEGKQYPKRPAIVLNAKLLHISEARTVQRVGIGAGERWANLLQESYSERHALLFFTGKTVPPFAERVREFNFPSHRASMAWMEYGVKSMMDDGI